MNEISQKLEIEYNDYRKSVLEKIQKSEIPGFLLKFPGVNDFEHLGIEENRLREMISELKNMWISTTIKGELKYIKSKKIYFSESYVNCAYIRSFYAKIGSFYIDSSGENLYYKKNGMWCGLWKTKYIRFSLEEIKTYITEVSLKNVERSILESRNAHDKLLKSLENIKAREYNIG